jgi:hypothetical protein
MLSILGVSIGIVGQFGYARQGGDRTPLGMPDREAQSDFFAIQFLETRTVYA